MSYAGIYYTYGLSSGLMDIDLFPYFEDVIPDYDFVTNSIPNYRSNYHKFCIDVTQKFHRQWSGTYDEEGMTNYIVSNLKLKEWEWML